MIKSESESKRFGLSVHRGETEEIDDKKIFEYILENKVDILILRVNSNTKAEQYKLTSLGFPVLHCDTIVHYAYDLKKHNYKKLRNSLDFKVAKEKDLPLLEDLISVIFKDYKSHYFNNPLLDNSKMIEGYQEWIKSHVNSSTDSIAWIVYKNHKPIGFAACTYNQEKKWYYGDIFGILPESGLGLYNDIVQFTYNYFKKLNYKKGIGVTQTNNFISQKLWASQGAKIFKSYDTYHINSFLSDSHLDFKTSVFFNDSNGEESVIFVNNSSQIKIKKHKPLSKESESVILPNIKFDVLVHKLIKEQRYPNIAYVLNHKTLYLNSFYSNTKYYVSIKFILENKLDSKELVIKLTDEEDKIICIAYVNVK